VDHFRLGDETGILDWYTILVGVLALFALVDARRLWVQMKNQRPKCCACGKTREPRVVGRRGAYRAGTAFTFRIQPQIKENLAKPAVGLRFYPAGRGGDSRRPV